MNNIFIFPYIIQLFICANCQDFYGLNTTVSYNIDAIDCVHNKTHIPFYDYMYESIINCYGYKCNITEYFSPIYSLEYIIL